MSEANAAAPAAGPAASAPGAEGTPAITAPAGNAAPLSIGDEGEPAKSPAANEGSTAAVSYDKTGDIGLDMALDFVGKLGFGPEDAAMVAATAGDFSLLRAKLGALGAKASGYENFLALAEKSHKDGATAAASKATADAAVIHSAVGGPEAWTAISKWAGENAEPAEKASINAVLKAGGFAAKLVAQGLAERYNKANGTVVEPADVAKPGAQGKADAVGPVSAKEFAMQSQALRGKLGPNFEKTPQYQALVIRRQAGQRAGK